MVVESRQDSALEEAVYNADLAAPDGMPLCKVLKIKDNIDQERVAGMDLVPELLKRSAEQGLKVFFYGDTDEVLDAIKQKSQAEFKGLQIAGAYSPPFRALFLELDILYVRIQCRLDP